MATPWLFRLAALLPNARQLTGYSVIIAQPAIILSKGGTLSLSLFYFKFNEANF
jgi:hypothetical protein